MPVSHSNNLASARNTADSMSSSPRTSNFNTPIGRDEKAPGYKSARFLLSLLVLFVALSPRIRLSPLGDHSVDLRLQDLILVPALIYVCIQAGNPFARLKILWGHFAFLFCFGSLCLLLLHGLLWGLELLYPIAVLGRALEILVLVVVSSALYRLGGTWSARTFLRTAALAGLLNSVWVGYQLVTSTSSTLLGDVYESAVYGPRLFGEPSVFGAGVFFVWVTSIGVSDIKRRVRPSLSATLQVVLGVAGAAVVQSRVALLCCVLLLVYLCINRRKSWLGNLARVAVLFWGLLLILLVTKPDILLRLTASDVIASSIFRLTNIWQPLIDVLISNPILGIGPGSLGTAYYPWGEAHNVFLRAILEYGVVVGSCFIGIFVVSLLRAWRWRDEKVRSLEGGTILTLGAVFGASVLVMGLFQDSLTAVMSTHLLAISLGAMSGEALESGLAHNRLL